MKILVLSFLMLFCLQTLGDGISDTVFHLSLADAEAKAIKGSHDLKAFAMQIDSIEQRSRIIHSKNLPQLKIEGQYRYLSEIGEIDLGANSIQFGDNENYSIGPAVTYNLFDGQSVNKSYESIKLLKKSKESEGRFKESVVRLEVRLAYINTLIKLEELKLNINSKKLAESQNREIRQKKKYGASGRIDLAISNRNVYAYQLKVYKKKNEFQHLFFSLLMLTGDIKNWKQGEAPLPLDLPGEGQRVQLDGLDKISDELNPDGLIAFREITQRVRSLQLMVQSHKARARSEQAKRWPRVLLKVKSSYDYPNGPSLESVQQNSMYINVSMPIWDGGEISARRGQELALASSYESQVEKAKNELRRDRERWSTELRNLREVALIAQKLTSEAKKVASINLRSYRAGQLMFTDVERSNLKQLEAEMNEILVRSKTFSAVAHLKAILGWNKL